MKKIFCLLLISSSVLTAHAQDNNEKNIELIKAARQSSNEAIAKHDIEGFSKFWYNNFVQIRGNSTYLAGKDTIVAEWKKLFAENSTVYYVRTPSQVSIGTNDTLAWETGTWKAFNSYSKGGNYSAMWRKSDNVWKIQAELFVSLF